MFANICANTNSYSLNYYKADVDLLFGADPV